MSKPTLLNSMEIPLENGVFLRISEDYECSPIGNYWHLTVRSPDRRYDNGYRIVDYYTILKQEYLSGTIEQIFKKYAPNRKAINVE